MFLIDMCPIDMNMMDLFKVAWFNVDTRGLPDLPGDHGQPGFPGGFNCHRDRSLWSPERESYGFECLKYHSLWPKNSGY